jgi:hypothetical protein
VDKLFAISRVVRVAAARFAPGHLGELTQQVPFEMVDAVLAESGAMSPASIPTERASPALHAARDQVVQAAGVIADTTIDLVGAIGRLVLDNLLPPRRERTNTRTVKRAISKYTAGGPNVDRPTHQATITITIMSGPA